MNLHPSPPPKPRVPPAGEERRLFRDHLKRRGLKMTRERGRIVEEVFRTEGHFRPEDLLDRFRGRGVAVSRATIYRTLDLLVSCGLVRRETFGGGTHYEHAHHVEGESHHDHLVCSACGAIFEFHNAEIERLQDSVCADFGFEPHGHTHQIVGLCADCRSRAGRS